MVGFSYQRFGPGERCWIVIGNNAETREFLEGEFIGYHPREIYAKIELMRLEQNPNAKAVRAKIIDQKVHQFDPKTGLMYGSEPVCNYAVLRQEGDINLLVHELNKLKHSLNSERAGRAFERRVLTDILKEELKD